MLEHKPTRKLQYQAQETAQTRAQKNTIIAPLFRNLEHKPNHKLQNPAPEKHNRFAFCILEHKEKHKLFQIDQKNRDSLSNLIKRRQRRGPGRLWERWEAWKQFEASIPLGLAFCRFQLCRKGKQFFGACPVGD